MSTATPAKRHRPGTASYDKGRATAAAILTVAKDIVLAKGIAGLTMRKIAAQMNMSPGNLSYYYASKRDLLEDLFGHVIQGFMDEFERLRKLEADSPIAQLRAVLEFVFDDLSTYETTYFFPELWAAALRDDWAEEQMEELYRQYRSVLIEIIAIIRPDLDDEAITDLALTVSASIEGHTVFIGHKRPHRDRAARIKRLVIEQSINLVQTTSLATPAVMDTGTRTHGVMEGNQ